MAFPRWVVWLLNIAVIGILWLVSQAFNFAGWQITLGFLIGYTLCYVFYGCWRLDDLWEGYKRFPPEERQARFERDRSIDPRL